MIRFDHSKNNFGEALGLTDERHDEIFEFVSDLLSSSSEKKSMLTQLVFDKFSDDAERTDALLMLGKGMQLMDMLPDDYLHHIRSRDKKSDKNESDDEFGVFIKH